MKRAIALIGATLLLVTTSRAQEVPGDRPAANPRATRSVVIGRRGMIATSQPLASAAGLKVLQEGGNAIDAAVTAAAVLAVVEPTMNGVGGDLFAIVRDGKTGSLRALNASGRSPYAMSPRYFAAQGTSRMPASGVHSITVPGVVDGWATLLATSGTISLARALAPAIEYARSGYAVSEIIARQWEGAERKLAGDPDAAHTFLGNGRAPRPGELFSNPNLARSLEMIAAGGRDAFYTGPLARAILAGLRAKGSLLEDRDFSEHKVDWVTPISTTYRGYDVYEMPPNTQGFVVLEMLNILEGFDIKALGHNSAPYLHLLAEAKRIGFADRGAYLADPDAVPQKALTTLISKDYAASRRKDIDRMRAAFDYKPAALAGAKPTARRDEDVNLAGRDRGDTIYMTAADGNGNAISLIQSLFSDFGSGVVAGETGIVLHNRGALFNLTPGHPDEIAPHKRPMHTLIPAFVMKDGKPFLSFGVMGGDHQAQGHVQVLVNMIDFGMNVQEAGEAARINHGPNGLQVESGISADARAGLTSRGHKVTEAIGAYGGYQGILFDPRTGVLMGGSDPRKDGLAIGF